MYKSGSLLGTSVADVADESEIVLNVLFAMFYTVA